MIRNLLLAVVLSLFALPAHAATDGARVLACLSGAEDAQTSPGSCIGLIFADCSKAPNADASACGAKELSFWQGQLDATLKRAQADIKNYPDEVKPQTDAQKAWATFRDKACIIADHVDPGTMPGGSAQCRAELTAERVFMLRRIVNSLEEH